MRSSSATMGAGARVGFRYQISSSGASKRSAVAVGSGSSSLGDAVARDANEIASPRARVHRAGDFVKMLANGPSRPRNKSERGLKEAMVVMLRPHHTYKPCATSG